MDHGRLASVLAGRPVSPEEVGPDTERDLFRLGLAPLWVAETLARGARVSELPGGAVSAYHHAAFTTGLLRESMARTVQALEAEAIPVLVFKGLSLVETGVYRDPGARPCEDVDLLVPPERARDSVHALRRAGFEPWEPWDDRRTGWVSSVALSDRSAPSGIDLDVDLHWGTPYTRLRQGPDWPEDPLWTGAAAHHPSPEGHFALVVEHVLKHLRVVSHLRGVGDLVRLLPTLTDGAALRNQAERRGSRPGLEAVLAFLEQELGVPLPETVVAALPGSRRGSRGAARRLRFDRLTAREETPDRLAGIFGDWLLLQSPIRAAGELARVLLPPARWLRARYGQGRALRIRYLKDLALWGAGRSVSPLSPNQGEL